MVEKHLSIGFQQSQIGECVFYKGDVIFTVYVDDGIFLGNNDNQLSDVIQEIKSSSLDVDNQGHPTKCMGHPHHAGAREDEGMWIPIDLHTSSCLLQGLRGQFWCSWNGPLAKITSKKQTY